MNPFKRKANSNDLIVLWETLVKPNLEAEIEKLFPADTLQRAENLTRGTQKENLAAFIDLAGARVAALAILDARGLAKNETKSSALTKL